MKSKNTVMKKLFSMLALTALLLAGFRASAQCQAGFTYNINGQAVTFTNTSTNSSQNTFWIWNFGDNGYSYTQNPVYNYQYGGTYVVCLSMYDSSLSCNSTFCDTLVIAGPCQATFSYYSGNDTAWFTGYSSTATPSTTYSWSFGDNTSDTGQNVMHAYANSQYYNVCLYISDPSVQCADTLCQNVYVNGNFVSSCQADFTWTTNGSTATFTNTSTGINQTTGYLWNFGDGGYSYNQNDTHTYQYGGTFNVCLTIWDSIQSCSSTTCYNVTVTGPPQPCNALFTLWQDSNNIYNYWAINYSTGANPITYTWNWGDGSPTDSLPYPSHTYAQPGIYPICLTINTGNGCTSTYCDSLQVFRLMASAASNPVTINVISPTGVNEQHKDEMQIFPNPVSELLFIKGYTPDSHYMICDVVGNLVKEGILHSDNISVNDLPKGMYLLKFSGNGAGAVKRFIKD
jgi:PKD repeat protein